MTHAHHDYAVQLLTDTQRFVRLVVEREIKGPLEPPQSPRSPSILKGLSPAGYMANRPGKSRRGRNRDMIYKLITDKLLFSSNEVYAGYRRSVDGPTEGNVNNVGHQQQAPVTSPPAATAAAPQPAPRRFGSLSSGPVDGEREVRIVVIALRYCVLSMAVFVIL